MSLPSWGRGSITVKVNVEDAFGFPQGLTLQIDQGTPVNWSTKGVSVSSVVTTSTVSQTATWPIDTTQYGPDAYHTLTIAGTEAAGYAFTLQKTLGFDNVAPTVCYPTQPSNLAVTHLAIADDLSGPASLSMNGVGFSATTGVHGGWHLWEGRLSRPQPTIGGPITVPNPVPVTAADQAGNVLNTSSSYANLPSCGFKPWGPAK